MLCLLSVTISNAELGNINTDPYSGSLTSSLTSGGTAGLFWGYIIVVIAFFLIYASLAEMAAM